MSALFKISNCLLVGLTFLSFIASAAFGQRLIQGTKPASFSIPEYSEAFCSAVAGDYRVCRARRSEEDAEFVVVKGTDIVNRVEASWKTIAVEPEGFFAYLGDLDKDGRAEIILLSLEGVSNGMGVTYSTAYIFDGRTLASGGKPISFDIQEFGQRENFIYNPQTRSTDILISYWASYDSIEPKRQSGMYLMGKWFRYRNARLEPIFEKPTLARRFLNSFASERYNGGFENRKPYAWLTDPRAHKLFREPKELSKPIKTRSGTVAKFDQPDPDSGEGPKMVIVTDDGQTLTGRIHGGRNGESEGKMLDIVAIGLWDAKYLYPLPFSGYFPAQTFLKTVEGRRVRLETYRAEYGGEYSKVWLLD